MFVRRTPPIPSLNSVASLQKIQIGGVEQWILIRGENRENPILLFLHGGPGSAQIWLAPRKLQELERDFTVVNWDQRGSGLSFSPQVSRSSMNIDQFVEDTRELVEWLQREFGRKPVYLMGQSWGSIVGTLTAAKYPHLIQAYIGVGQVAAMPLGEAVSYQYVLDRATAEGNSKALRDLERIGRPPYRQVKDGGVQRNWLEHFGGGILRHGTMAGLLFKGALAAPEYTLLDYVKFIRGVMFSLQTLEDLQNAVDLTTQVPELTMPAYFILGRHDYTIPCELAAAYFEKLRAPHKRLFWIEDVAHGIWMEQPHAFAEVLHAIRMENLTEAASTVMK